MANILFRRLFEIRILHGYYLDAWFSDQNGPLSFYKYGQGDPELQANRQAYILEKKYNLLKDLTIEPTRETANFFDNANIRWRNQPAGIVAGIEVAKREENGVIKFFPKAALPQDISWSFVIRLRNAYYYNITNHALRTTVPGRYFFTNLRAVEDGKLYPSLSTQLPVFSNLRTWEMGELVRDGVVVKAAKQNTNVFGDFTNIAEINSDPDLNTWHQFAHSGDRVALPKRFKYRFDAVFNSANPVQNATIHLKALDNTILKSFSWNFSVDKPAPEEIPIDFRYLPASTAPPIPALQKPVPIANGNYQIEVNINGSVFESRQILLNDSLGEENSTMGLITISTADTAPDFRILNADGSLNVLPKPGVDPVRWEPRIFQIRLMSRRTYWRYKIMGNTNPDPGNVNFDWDATRRLLISHSQRQLTQVRSPIQLNASILLPSPDRPDLQFEQKRFYSELYLSTL